MHQTPDSADITAIEYHRCGSGWKPFVVWAGGTEYDFQWCKQDGILAYYLSGSGPDPSELHLSAFADATKLCAKLWYDHARLHLVDGTGRQIADKDARKLGYQVIPEPLDGNPFEDDDAIEGDTEYCQQCGDYHPSEQMCRHVQ